MVSSLQELWYYVARETLTLPAVLGFGLRVEGRENVPQDGPTIVASNHQSFLDPVLIGVPIRGRPCHFLARETLFRPPVFGALIRSVNAHPVRRGEVDRQALRTMLDVLRAGRLLVMFPEGTRTPNGRIGPLKPGVGTLAAKTDAWIVPTYLSGAFECWPRSQKLFRLGRVRISYAPPFKADKADRGAAANARLEQELRRLEAEHARLRCAAAGRRHEKEDED